MKRQHQPGMRGNFKGRCPNPSLSLQRGWGVGKVGKVGGGMLLVLQDFVEGSGSQKMPRNLVNKDFGRV